MKKLIAAAFMLCSVGAYSQTTVQSNSKTVPTAGTLPVANKGGEANPVLISATKANAPRQGTLMQPSPATQATTTPQSNKKEEPNR